MLGELGGAGPLSAWVRRSSGGARDVVGGSNLSSSHSSAFSRGREETALGGSAVSGCYRGNRLAAEEVGLEGRAGVGSGGSDALAYCV